jgi:hypothetical protein
VVVQSPSLRIRRQPEHHTEVKQRTSATAAGSIVDVGPTLPEQDSDWRAQAREMAHPWM